MALIKCPECGNEVSENAATCPNCGNPIAQKEQRPQQPRPLPPPTLQQVPKKRCKHCKAEIPAHAKVCPHCNKKQGGVLKWVIIGIAVIGIIGAAAGGGKNPESDNRTDEPSSANSSDSSKESIVSTENTATPEPTEDPKANPEITLAEIKEQAQELNYKDVMRNPDNYLGQYFCVTVKISTVENGSLFSSYDKAYKSYTNDDYNLWIGDMIYLLDNRDTESEEYIKLLEDDTVIIYGRFDGLIETKNVLNGTKGEEMSLQILFAELVSE